MGGHTKEPWSVWEGNIPDVWPGIAPADDRLDAIVIQAYADELQDDGGVRGATNEEANANADRIVECVNALAGIANPSAVSAVIQAARELTEAHEQISFKMFSNLNRENQYSADLLSKFADQFRDRLSALDAAETNK